MSEPAPASARAMPSPMPLVEPVMSETLPFTGCATGTEDIIAAIVMANALGKCPA
jgi:hypothetical protein